MNGHDLQAADARLDGVDDCCCTLFSYPKSLTFLANTSREEIPSGMICCIVTTVNLSLAVITFIISVLSRECGRDLSTNV